MTFLNKKGVSMVETLASIVIITFVLVTVLSIIINVREETNNTNHRVIAVSIADQVRDDINQNYVYSDLFAILSSEDIIINQNNCQSIDLTGLCAILDQTFENVPYDKPMTLTFLTPSTESETYGFVEYTIRIEYVDSRDIEIEGIIYE